MEKVLPIIQMFFALRQNCSLKDYFNPEWFFYGFVVRVSVRKCCVLYSALFYFIWPSDISHRCSVLYFVP